MYSPVPVPGTVPKRSVHPAEGGALDQPEGLALWGGSGRGAQRWAEPVAARRQEHRASRRGTHTPRENLEHTQVFRLLCALIRAELRAHPDLNWRDYTDLVEHMKTAAAKAQLPYGQDKLTRALNAIERSDKARAPKRPEPAPRVHWRDRCTHSPRCQTPTQCDLRATKEGRG
jgi:hypothetical protein